MKHRIHVVIGAIIACVVLPAQASGSYAATFQLDQMPQLRTGTSADGPGVVDGSWSQDVLVSNSVYVREATGIEIHPGTGAPVPVWGHWPRPLRGETPSGSLAFGSSDERIDGAVGSGPATARSEGAADRLTPQVTGGDIPAEGWGQTQWSRGFSLAPGASFTFAGLAMLDITSPVSPLDARAHQEASWTRLAYEDTLGRAGVALAGWLTSDSRQFANPFDYFVGNDGRLSLTVTNNGTETMQGGLHLQVSVDSDAAQVAAAVPEPATWLMLLGGAALAGGVARRRGTVLAARPAA